MQSLMAGLINGIPDPNEVSEIVGRITRNYGIIIPAENEKAADKTIPLETLQRMIEEAVRTGFGLAEMKVPEE